MNRRYGVAGRRNPPARLWLPPAAAAILLLGGAARGADPAPAVPAEEARLLKTVELGVQAAQAEGAWSVLRGRRPQYLRPDAALLQALHKNLELRVGKAEQDKAGDAIREAQAIYDPVLEVALGKRQGRSFERSIYGTVVERKFRPISPQSGLAQGADSDNPLVDEIGFRQQAEDVTVEKEITVSQRQSYGVDKSSEYGVSIDQLLPWGTRLSLALQTVDKRTYYEAVGRNFDYGAPWSSGLLLDLVSPLPGGAGFGADSAQAAEVELRRKDQELAHWQVKAAIEAVTVDVDAAYWLLVARLQQLDLAVDTVRLVDEQAQHTRRLIQGGRATNFEGALLDGELARARAREEEARQLYVTASQALALLLEDSSEAVEKNVYLPVGFSRLLAPAVLPAADAGLANAMKERADVHLQALDGAVSGLQLAAARNQARPDVKFSASLQNQQDGSVYGYKSLGDSLGAIFDPDSRTQKYGLAYNYPLFNRAAQGRVSAATATSEDSVLATRQLQRRVRDEIDDGNLRLRLLAQKIAAAEGEVKHLQTAYDRLLRRREIGADVNENELIETLRNLYAARAAALTGKVERKQAETALFRAMGMLQQLQMSDAADGGFDRRRLALLARSGELRYFTPPSTPLRPQAQP